MDMKKYSKQLGAEFIGTFLLVFGGCGSAIFAAKALGTAKGVLGEVDGVKIGTAGIFNVGIGYLGVSLAFGLTVLCGAYALGHVSGGHFNPAVSVGLATAKRFDWKELPGYVVVQCLGAIAAVACLWAIKSGVPGGFKVGQGSFASNAFAILGLRALYFLLADMRDRFQYLQTGLGVILAFVGVKMTLSYWWHFPIAASLSVIGLILAVSIVASVRSESVAG